MQRQEGFVRIRAMEFDVREVTAEPAVLDIETGEVMVVTTLAPALTGSSGCLRRSQVSTLNNRRRPLARVAVSLTEETEPRCRWPPSASAAWLVGPHGQVGLEREPLGAP